jgi:hypothetical protein
MQFIIKADGKGLDIRLTVTWRSASALMLAIVTLVTLAATNMHKVATLLGW